MNLSTVFTPISGLVIKTPGTFVNNVTGAISFFESHGNESMTKGLSAKGSAVMSNVYPSDLVPKNLGTRSIFGLLRKASSTSNSKLHCVLFLIYT